LPLPPRSWARWLSFRRLRSSGRTSGCTSGLSSTRRRESISDWFLWIPGLFRHPCTSGVLRLSPFPWASWWARSCTVFFGGFNKTFNNLLNGFGERQCFWKVYDVLIKIPKASSFWIYSRVIYFQVNYLKSCWGRKFRVISSISF